MKIVSCKLKDIEKQEVELYYVKKMLDVGSDGRCPVLYLLVDDSEVRKYEVIIKRLNEEVTKEEYSEESMYMGSVLLSQDWHVRHIFLREIKIKEEI